ncbi:MAG: DUF456 domain-containing protein [Candidatus Dadabacteria bacterium]|nr:DUF456 domain-containing protein [Candidatus Dadabacteria bacterium]NIS07574.1 DUF456 domain-containing protein [Candidatus Dadabacteria bacterium]NIY21208.1 DUF456 family protein [Candidatus Dadabacteria bacterium]
MDILAVTLYIAFALAGIFCIFIGLPGNFLILITSGLLAWYFGFEVIKINIIILLAVLAVLGEVLEFVIGILGSKRKKASNKAIAGSVIFSIIGAILFAPVMFGLGAIIGAFLGAFFGAFIVELVRFKDAKKAVESGKGAFLGRLGGVLVKTVIGFIMITTTLMQVF